MATPPKAEHVVQDEPTITDNGPFSVPYMERLAALDAAADEPAPDPIPEPEKSEHQKAVETLGVGGQIEVQANEFRVKSGGQNPRYGHGKTVDAAMDDLRNPGQLKITNPAAQ